MSPTPLPYPLESGSGNNGLAVESVGGMGGPVSTISLSILMQYVNQRTYSDLLNLAEILPRKSDMEKKIDIVHFAQRTRQLYVRLLALVKWAASASKVDKCCHIMAFLEKQNSLFADTADKLFHTTRETLVRARLPHFHIPAAVEALTTGSYDRLPMTIRQRILPLEPITPAERKQTLVRLEQIVQHRLLTTDLPKQMRYCKIENGRVRFTVEHEFEVSLTLMGDSVTEPWRLLEIEILVEDKETGDGKALVHPLQVGYIHQLIQSRLHENPNPLNEVYCVLHAFAQSLQLEVLYAQTLKLLEERLNFHVRIEEYTQGHSLALTYWRELAKDCPTVMGYRLSVEADSEDPMRPLVVYHTPSLSSKESEFAERAIRSDHLSIERLLVHSIYLRTKARLSELKQELDERLGPDAEKCHLSGSPAVLQVSLLQPCLSCEQLLIAVNTHTGVLLPHIPQYSSCPVMTEFKQCLNADKPRLSELIKELRFRLMVTRIEKTLQHLAATAHERLPLMYSSQHPLNSLSKHKVFVTFHRHSSYILIVEFTEKPGCCEMGMSLYLLVVKEASIEDDPNDDSIQTNVPKSFLRAYKLLLLDSFICTHGPSTKVDIFEPGDRILGSKRKLQNKAESASKKVKMLPYFLPEVAQVVSLCDQIFPLALLSHQFEEEGILTGGVQVEEGGLGVMMKLLDLPFSKEIRPENVETIRKHLLSVTIRVLLQQKKGKKTFVVEYVFTDCPVVSQHAKEQGVRQPVYRNLEVQLCTSVSDTVHQILSDWDCCTRLYELVLMFAEYYGSANDAGSSSNDGNVGSSGSCTNGYMKSLDEMVHVHSFKYRSICFAYGQNFDFLASVTYEPQRKAFVVSLGMGRNGIFAGNSHSLLINQLEEVVNSNGLLGLVYLATVLHQTYQPLIALAKLQPLIIDRKPIPVQIFTIVPHSVTRLRVIYRNFYCLEIDLLDGCVVSVRDGAFSHFDTSKVIKKFTPIQGFKSFLSKYSDESLINRRSSVSEEDPPPTPISMEESPWLTPKSSSPARHGPITPPVSSNPHTPASPHPAGVSQVATHGAFSASPAGGGAAFSLASPPSIPGVNPSPITMMSHPSPGGSFLGASSPGQVHSVASPVFMPTLSPAGHFTTPSPASQLIQGLGTTSSSKVTRYIPHKPSAAAVPTFINHEALMTLCLPLQGEGRNPAYGKTTVLEQFLGSTYLRQHLLNHFKDDEQVSEHGVVQIKVETLILVVSLESTPSYCLTLKVQPSVNYTDRWTQDELQTVEKFFATRVSCPPYRLSVLTSFCNMFRLSYKILKDFVRIMHLQMMTPIQLQQQQMKWTIQWYLTIPPIIRQLLLPGSCALLIKGDRVFFILQFSRVPYIDNDPCDIVVPFMYDTTSNKIQVIKRTTDPTSYSLTLVSELVARVPINTQEVSIFPCVRELVLNLTVNTEGSAYPRMAGLSRAGPIVSQTHQSPMSTSTSQPPSSSHMSSAMPISSASMPVSSLAQSPSMVTATHYSTTHGTHMGPSMGTMVGTNMVQTQGLQGLQPGVNSSMAGIQQPMGTIQGGIMPGGARPIQASATAGGQPGMQVLGTMQGTPPNMQSGFAGPAMNQFPR